MYHCSLPDEEGWWYLFDEPGFGVTGSHEEYVSLQPVYQTVTRPTMSAIPVT
jgi:hypothetical protein